MHHLTDRLRGITVLTQFADEASIFQVDSTAVRHLSSLYCEVYNGLTIGLLCNLIAALWLKRSLHSGAE